MRTQCRTSTQRRAFSIQNSLLQRRNLEAPRLGWKALEKTLRLRIANEANSGEIVCDRRRVEIKEEHGSASVAATVQGRDESEDRKGFGRCMKRAEHVLHMYSVSMNEQKTSRRFARRDELADEGGLLVRNCIKPEFI